MLEGGDRSTLRYIGIGVTWSLPVLMNYKILVTAVIWLLLSEAFYAIKERQAPIKRWLSIGIGLLLLPCVVDICYSLASLVAYRYYDGDSVIQSGYFSQLGYFLFQKRPVSERVGWLFLDRATVIRVFWTYMGYWYHIEGPIIFGAIWLGTLATVRNAIQSGLKVVMHDRFMMVAVSGIVLAFMWCLQSHVMPRATAHLSLWAILLSTYFVRQLMESSLRYVGQERSRYVHVLLWCSLIGLQVAREWRRHDSARSPTTA
jgi:hypothetical protein